MLDALGGENQFKVWISEGELKSIKFWCEVEVREGERRKGEEMEEEDKEEDVDRGFVMINTCNRSK
jgi:hypothetical protein